jgi:hypothetical protein
MSATCQNCKSKLSCGCQKRTASDGKGVCTMCLTQYEGTLQKKTPVTTPQPPSNVTVIYNAPVKK